MKPDVKMFLPRPLTQRGYREVIGSIIEGKEKGGRYLSVPNKGVFAVGADVFETVQGAQGETMRWRAREIQKAQVRLDRLQALPGYKV